jgi:[acyl-carrier-protein] S-malonyltransferase
MPPLRIGVVFPGQGSQFVGMANDIVRSSPEATELFARAHKVLGYDLLAITREGPDERLLETRYAQPAIFAVNLALYAALGKALTPIVSAGHSFGEYCSLTIAGALTFENALALVNARGCAMQAAAQLAPGGMSAILGLDEATVRALTEQTRLETGARVRSANFNAPTQIVVSGDLAAVRRVGEKATAAGAGRVVALNVAGAWHSELMEPARVSFAPAVAAAQIAVPRFTVISNVDALPYADTATIRANLVRSVTDAVLWRRTMLRMLEERLDLIVEFGAQAVLAPMTKRIPGAPAVMHVGDSVGVAKLAEKIGASISA